MRKLDQCWLKLHIKTDVIKSGGITQASIAINPDFIQSNLQFLGWTLQEVTPWWTTLKPDRGSYNRVRAKVLNVFARSVLQQVTNLQYARSRRHMKW